VELKTSQFYEISEEKLQGLVKETEKLRGELERSRKELKQSLVERDFLDRFNRNLKTQCETLTKEILQLREANHDLKRPEKHLHSAREELELSKSRHSSNDLQLPRRKDTRKEETPHPHNATHNHTTHLKTTLSASRLHDDYYSSRPVKPKPGLPQSRV
jgi:chromosome segregation ATPase